MDADRSAAILNELFNLELHRHPIRLIESAAFVSARSQADHRQLLSLAKQAKAHVGAIADLMYNLGATPHPTPPSLDSAGYHFTELGAVRNMLVEEQTRTVEAFQQAAQQLSKFPRAAALVGALLEEHRQTLAALTAQKNARG